MKEEKNNILIIIVFIAIITLPQICYKIIHTENLEISNSEKRMLSSKPDFNLTTITQYPEKFEEYYNDHLPFRNYLRNMWANLNYELFNTTVDNNVVIGKEGWLFYRGDSSILQAQGIKKYSNKNKAEILNNLQKSVDKLKEKNIKTFVFIIPNKENIYKEYLPSTIPIVYNVSRTEELIDYIKDNSDINIIYAKEDLLKAKEKYQIYEKYDTHWNRVGAFFGTIILQKSINSEYYYDINNIQIEKCDAKDANDLANFASLDKKLYENIVRVKNFYPEVQFTIHENEKYKEYISNSNNDQTVLVIRDSFGENMEEYFSKLYKRTVYVHCNKYEPELIDKIKPDIVVIESVERYSYTIGDYQ